MLPFLQPGTCIVVKQLIAEDKYPWSSRAAHHQFTIFLRCGEGPWQMGRSSTMEHLSERTLGDTVLDIESGNNMLRGGSVFCVEHTWHVPGWSLGRKLPLPFEFHIESAQVFLCGNWLLIINVQWTTAQCFVFYATAFNQYGSCDIQDWEESALWNGSFKVGWFLEIHNSHLKNKSSARLRCLLHWLSGLDTEIYCGTVPASFSLTTRRPESLCWKELRHLSRCLRWLTLWASWILRNHVGSGANVCMGNNGNVSFNRSCCHMRLLGLLWPAVKFTGWLVMQCLVSI